jgi:hypothetical protein
MKMNIIGPAGEARSKVIDAQELMNFYVEVESKDSKNYAALIGTPGLRPHTTLANGGPVRGIYTTSGNRVFAVCGFGLYEVDQAGNNESRGTLLSSNGQVYFADNGDEILITDGLKGYLFDLGGNTLTTLTTSNGFPDKAGRCAFIAGLFIINRTGTGQFYASDSYDGLTWDPLAFATAEGFPDALSSVVVSKNELWFIGTQSSEVWYVTGDSSYPFARVSGGLNNIGSNAPDSIATNGNQVFWLGSNAAGNGIVWAATGYTPERISTHGIEYAISQLGTTSDAIGYCYQQEGHAYYVLNFVTAGKTFVYDLSTNLWHERGFWDTYTGQFYAHAITCHACVGTINLVGGWRAGKIYQYDLGYYLDDTDLIRRVRTTPHISNENKRVTVDYIELEMERGAGLVESYRTITTGSTVLENGCNPQMIMNTSDDGGFTWSDNRYATTGRMGAYRTRIRWNRCGTGRDRLFRFSTTDPVKIAIVDAYAQMESET